MNRPFENVRSPNRSFYCRIRKKSVIDDKLYPDYLMHHGIKGQQWGIRRYQNEDGTLTEEGKLRYNDSSPESKKWDKRETSYLTDEELNRRNLRLQREQQYRTLTTSDKERDREQLKKDFKKKLLTAVLITPVIALAGVAAKKNLGKVTNLIGNFAKKKVAPLKAANMLKNTLKQNPSMPYPDDLNSSFGKIGKHIGKIGKGIKQHAPGPKIYDNGVYASPLMKKRAYWRGLGRI